MITPILKDPKSHGGTLYTFPSASRDLTRAFSNSEYEFAFSHFACLNLPDFRYGNFEENDVKGIYLDDLCPDCMSLSAYNINRALKWHIQSYVMNCEIGILNEFSLNPDIHDTEILRTSSERIFFNWLQKVNAIKFENDFETLKGYGDDVDKNDYIVTYDESGLIDKTKNYRIGNKLYTWKGGEWRSRILVSNTVQYIGTIDMVNNVNIDFDSFNEIYLNIPSNVGKSTSVKFYNTFDDNYLNGDIIDIDNDKYCDDDKRDFIIGRDPEKLNMQDDITLNAIYDLMSDSENKYEHKYKIETGYCINFNDNEYSDGNGRLGIEAMNMGSEEDFEFNCVLIYYRIKKGNSEWYTNLYGVLFLEEVTISDTNNTINDDDERAGYIQRYPKFKKGNSWGLKLDLKIDAQPDSQMELRDKTYDDPNESGYGMQLFTEALMQLNDCTKLFYDVKKENTDIEERLYTLENIMSGVDDVYSLRNDVGVLRTRVETLTATVDGLDGTLDDLYEKISGLEHDLGLVIHNISKVVDDKIINLENKVDTLNNTIKKYKLIIEDID